MSKLQEILLEILRRREGRRLGSVILNRVVQSESVAHGDVAGKLERVGKREKD
jgi:hypothetical protein